MVKGQSRAKNASRVGEIRPLNQRILAVEILANPLCQRKSQDSKVSQPNARVNHPGVQVVENVTVESLLAVIDKTVSIILNKESISECLSFS